MNPDQTAPKGAVRSGFIFIAIIGYHMHGKSTDEKTGSADPERFVKGGPKFGCYFFLSSYFTGRARTNIPKETYTQ